jgi:hypothetical protein
MINLSVPFWVLGTFIGVICSGLLVAALIIGYKVRRLKSREGLDVGISHRAAAMVNTHFQHNLLGMQVDAVFNSLTALIETERLRLKTLMAPTVQSMPVPAPRQCQTAEPAPVHEEPEPALLYEEPAPQMEQEHPADPAYDGSPANQVEPGPGMARAERELVEKMRAFQARNHRKLEAVV